MAASDLMLREPKTLEAYASVVDVRAQLANPKVQMVLLADGPRFVGAVTEIPADAADDERAVMYADPAPQTISPDASDEVAFERTAASPHRRVIVVDDDGMLLGLLCLDPTLTRFCRTASSAGRAS